MKNIINFCIIMLLFNSIILDARFERLVNGLPSEGFAAFTIAVDKKFQENVFVGASGYLYHSSDNGYFWSKVESFEKGSGITISNILACYPMIIVVSSTLGRLNISNDYGKTWRIIDTLCQKTTYGDTSCSLEYYTLNYFNDTIFIGTNIGPFMSLDYGIHWIPLFNGNQRQSWINSIILHNNKLYVLADERRIYFSTDMGNNWLENKELNLDKGYTLYEILKFQDMILAFCAGGPSYGFKVYTLKNDSDKWELIMTMKDSLINNLKFCNNVIFATGAKDGIFYSNDTCKSWIVYNDGLDYYNEKKGYNSAVGDISENYLYVISASLEMGSRLYRAKIYNCEIINETDVPEHRGEVTSPLQIYPNPASDQLTIRMNPQVYLWGQNEVQIEVYNVLGEIVEEIPIIPSELNPPLSQPQRDRGEVEVDVSGLPQGLYYVVVKAGGQAVTKQFAVVR